MFAKIFVVLLMLVILFWLGNGLYFLLRDKGRSERTVTALSWRIGLSLSLFALLIIGYMLGIIHPHPPGF